MSTNKLRAWLFAAGALILSAAATAQKRCASAKFTTTTPAPTPAKPSKSRRPRAPTSPAGSRAVQRHRRRRLRHATPVSGVVPATCGARGVRGPQLSRQRHPERRSRMASRWSTTRHGRRIPFLRRRRSPPPTARRPVTPPTSACAQTGSGPVGRIAGAQCRRHLERPAPAPSAPATTTATHAAPAGSRQHHGRRRRAPRQRRRSVTLVGDRLRRREPADRRRAVHLDQQRSRRRDGQRHRRGHRRRPGRCHHLRHRRQRRRRLPPTCTSTTHAAADGSDFHINEIHYDNLGTDAGEAIEIEGPAGADVTGFTRRALQRQRRRGVQHADR